jgi:dTDP-4-dehydrorhamnose reductase
MKFLVLGATGMLGASLVPALAAKGHTVQAHGRSGAGFERTDLADRGQTARLIERLAPEVVVNLAGLTDVERCQTHPQEAWLANVRTVENVAAATRAAGCHLIHISTDQVYDADTPSREDDARPGNSYALTKYAGELAAMAAPATVLRTNFFGASRHASRRSFSDWLHASLVQGQAIQVFEDVRFSPLSMRTLGEAIERLALLRPAGIFNLGSQAGMSKADFAYAFAAALDLPTEKMTRSTVQQSGLLKTWRPKDMRMDSSRIEAILGTAMPTLTHEIQLAAEDYRVNL